jgi:hypothetical protein
MNTVLLFGRKNLLLWFGRYHLTTSLFANMKFGLAMSLGSHKSSSSALCPHYSRVISIHLPLGAPSWEHHKKGSDMLGGSWSRMWLWLENRRAETEGFLHV